jgi:hypothetical protein
MHLFPGRCHARCRFHAVRKGKNGPQLAVGVLGTRNTRIFRCYSPGNVPTGSGRRPARVIHIRTVVITFPTAPRRTGLAPFNASGSPVLQCLFTTLPTACHGFPMHEAGCRFFSTHWASMRDVYMAGRTDNHRFALAGCHQHHPSGPWLSAFWMEVFQCSDMVYLTSFVSTAVLTITCQKPFL